MNFRLVVILVTLQMAGMVFSSRTQKFTNRTGDVSSYSGERISYRIRVPTGNKIIISISNLTLSNTGYLKLQDGSRGEDRTFRRFGFGIYEMTKYGGIKGGRIVLPLEITTVTRKLLIRYFSEEGYGFSAHYTSFNRNQGCPKNGISVKEDGPQITAVDCDTDALSPVASQCRVTLDCGPNHIQYNNLITCEYGEWDGKFDCHPKKELLDTCVYDFDNVTAEQNSTCPYTPKEVAQYYIDVENVVIFTSQVLSRSSQSGMTCGKVCDVYGNGKYVVNCNKPKSRKQKVRCLLCRLVHKCQLGSIFF